MWKPSAWSKLSAKGLRNWDGPRAATFGSITAGQAAMSAESELLQGIWSSCRPTSWSAMPLLPWQHYNRRHAPSQLCSYRSITGFAVLEFSLGTKWMGALKQIAPSLKRVTTIFNPKTAPYYSLYLDAIEKAASSFAVEPIVVEVHDDADIERAISTL